MTETIRLKHKGGTLIKIDRNGSKHFEGMVECDRCQGRGWFATGVCNGQLVPSRVDHAVCWKCNGEGFVKGKWIERTPEYQAKLDAKREAKIAALMAQREAEEKAREAERKEREERREAERKEREERIKAEKAISQFVGTVGEKIEIRAEYVASPYFTRQCFAGYGTEKCFIHTFKDEAGNKIVWKTASGLNLEAGAMVTIKGTVKEHSEYKDEKQTNVIRCKILK